MNLLSREDLEAGPKGFAFLVSVGVPLLVLYRLSGGNIVVAGILTAMFWFGSASLWRFANRRGERRRQQELTVALGARAQKRASDPWFRNSKLHG